MDTPLFQQEIFKIGNSPVFVWHLLLGILLLGAGVFLALPMLRRFSHSTGMERSKVKRLLLVGFLFTLLAVGTLVLLAVGWDVDLFDFKVNPGKKDAYSASITVLTLLQGVVVIGLAWIFERLTEAYVSIREDNQELQAERFLQARRFIRPLAYALTAVVLVRVFQIAEFIVLERGKETLNRITIHLEDIIWAMVFVTGLRLLNWLLTHRVFRSYYEHKRLDVGVQYAINRLFTYLLYFIGFLLVIENLGFDLVGIWTGTAALLVGVGIGLQQTFNDLISGIILLIERSIEVGDILEVDGMVGRVVEIRTRTCIIETRESITVVLPNSKLVGDKAINWSHQKNQARFFVSVGVAYGSDTSLVRDTLLGIAKKHPKVLRYPEPFVRFWDFGDSALVFHVYFFSEELMRIENVKSDIRFSIDDAFHKAGIAIPFPQRDLWIRNPQDLRG